MTLYIQQYNGSFLHVIGWMHAIPQNEIKKFHIHMKIGEQFICYISSTLEEEGLYLWVSMAVFRLFTTENQKHTMKTRW